MATYCYVSLISSQTIYLYLFTFHLPFGIVQLFQSMYYATTGKNGGGLGMRLFLGTIHALSAQIHNKQNYTDKTHSVDTAIDGEQ